MLNYVGDKSKKCTFIRSALLNNYKVYEMGESMNIIYRGENNHTADNYYLSADYSIG